MSRLTVPQVIDRLMAAGLDSIPGGGAEILVDRVRLLLNCYGKATADEWLDVMRQAHRKGLRTTATMMYGHVETVAERIEHLLRLREVQDETGGFTAFITWSYQPEHTWAAGKRRESSTSACSASRGSSSTISRACRRRGSRRAARSVSSAWRTARMTWAA
jgi:cyclic dehypoxanthinyl futalosine synthase